MAPRAGPRFHPLRTIISVFLVVAAIAVVLVVVPAAQSLVLGSKLTSVTDFGISGSVSNLAPGLGSPLDLTVSNPYTNAEDAITLLTVTVQVSPTSTITSVPANCPGTDLSLQYNDVTTPLTGSPAQATVTLLSPQPMIPASSSASFTDISVLLATGASNTGCQNVTFPFNYSATGSYKDATTTTVASSSPGNTADVSQPVTYTATVTPSMSGQSSNPTGTVIFYDASTPIGCSSSTPFNFNGGSNTGTATCTTSYGSTGAHSISAMYSGDSDFAASTSATITEVVVESACVSISTGGSNTTTITGTYGGNFEVTAGKVLYIKGGTITGNVKVDAAGALLASAGTINGNLQSSGGPVAVQGTTVDGNLQATDAQASVGAGTTVDGNLQVSGTSVFCSLGSTTQPVTVKGNLQVQSLLSSSTNELICGTAVSGNILYQSNASPATVGGGTSNCPGNTTNGNFQVQSNTAALVIDGNKAAGNFLVQSNTALLSITGNTTGGNFQVSGNTLPAHTYPPYSTLTNNTTDPSGGNCQLSGDSPGITGSGNTVPTGRANTCNGSA
ncbi:MAG: Ig-like domain-containing protein [Candidatus Dormiibacterota bacterium]